MTNFSDIIKFIIPHFDKFPLQSTKAVSYYLFKAVADLMVKKVHVTLPGYMEVLTYKAASPLGLEAKIFSSFSDITPHNVENVFVPDSQSILEPEYVSGFVAADGTFLSLYRLIKQNGPITMQHLLSLKTNGMRLYCIVS